MNIRCRFKPIGSNNMKSLKNNKSIVVAVIIFSVALGIYQLFLKPSPAIDVSLSGESVEGVGADVVRLRDSLQQVSLDTSLFSSLVYRALVDFTSELSPQPIGRNNPFGPIGND
jgi:hypothetical protein